MDVRNKNGALGNIPKENVQNIGGCYNDLFLFFVPMLDPTVPQAWHNKMPQRQQEPGQNGTRN
jgi:hypothetical protein